MKFLIAAILGLILTGCANQNRLYQWGGYDSLLYQSYKNPEKAEEFRLELEEHTLKMEQTNQKVAPGLYAELGTLYLQKGDKPNALKAYGKERDMWPESKGLMDAMIKNIDKPANKKDGEPKS
jgi:hypothetical protein